MASEHENRDYFSYCTLTYTGEELPLAVEQIADAGYDGIEIYPKDWQWGMKVLGKKSFQRLFSDAGLCVSAVFGGVLDEKLGNVEEAAKIGQMIGAKYVFVVAPVIGTVEYSQCVDILHRASRLASEYKETLLIHNHAGTFMESLETSQKLCAAVQDLNFGLCLDSLHFALFDDNIENKLSGVLPFVKYVHLKDLDISRRELYKVTPKEEWRWGNLQYLEFHYTDLNSGVIDNAKIAAIIKAYGFSGWWLPEIERAYMNRQIHLNQNYERIKRYF